MRLVKMWILRPTASRSARAPWAPTSATTSSRWCASSAAWAAFPSAHLRNVAVEEDGTFYESAHLSCEGSLDMAAILRAYHEVGFEGYVRPDHGRMIWGETGKPGYGLYDRALGAVYLTASGEAITSSFVKEQKS